ncbi:hypothetical protein [Deinococcus sp. Leaf326]|uniref:hypothetical protein n=1 Tax=Deinococcus sp. Leaf326 TaxID=1736338 RepID=UPI0006FC1423|nr:hypothetical protein [Deinococcus sp. Leaf326]KQR40938.1 hypothetical protein ASF71_02010 [Deinococcus sp. Leaf326]
MKFFTLFGSITSFKRLTALVLAGSIGQVSAVGDLAQRVTGAQAIRDYQVYSKLLALDQASSCLTNQRLIEERITEGASPSGSSRSQVFTFSEGGAVSVQRTWSSDSNGHKLGSIAIKLACP